jgi:hypothetical protein
LGVEVVGYLGVGIFGCLAGHDARHHVISQ